jgi:hypothetical protein
MLKSIRGTTTMNSSNTKSDQTTIDFVTAINSFHWNCDYIKFCETLELTPDSYAEQKYSEFQQFISYVNKFGVDSLSKMVTRGGGNR